jgi:hypothetical protein
MPLAARASANPVGPASYTARTGRPSSCKNAGTTVTGTAQALHTQLAAERIEHRSDRLRLMNIKPDKSHTLRHGRHLP